MITTLRNAWRRFRQKVKENTPYLVVSTLLALFVVAYLFHRIFIIVPAGHAGVHYKLFGNGTDINNIYGEGLHLVYPWNSITVYNMRIQEVDREIDVLTADGLAIETTMSIRFRPTFRLLGMLHKAHGPDYVESYMMAELGSSARRIIGLVKPHELYSTARDSIELAIDKHLLGELRETDDFLSSHWPHPPDYEKLMNSAGMIRALDSLETTGADIDSFKAAIIDSLNLNLIVSQFPAALKSEVDSLGAIELYTSLLSQYDMIVDSRHVLSGQLSHLASRVDDRHLVLADEGREGRRRQSRQRTMSRLGPGLRPRRPPIDLRDTTLQAEYNVLLQKDLVLAGEGRMIYSKLQTMRIHYDNNFMPLDIHDVLIKAIVLPEQIAQAIVTKLEQEQIAEQFVHILTKEKREAERKRIEAKGIKDFQDIIADGITPDFLRWKGIEATVALSESNNAKVIVIGSGEDGLPLILNTAP